MTDKLTDKLTGKFTDYKISVPLDEISKIVINELLWDLSSLKKSLTKVKEEKKGHCFSVDYEEDKHELKRMIKSYKKILKYYGVTEYPCSLVE